MMFLFMITKRWHAALLPRRLQFAMKGKEVWVCDSVSLKAKTTDFYGCNRCETDFESICVNLSIFALLWLAERIR
jgi:hypothetical protein